jgi:hypothetical protein
MMTHEVFVIWELMRESGKITIIAEKSENPV